MNKEEYRKAFEAFDTARIAARVARNEARATTKRIYNASINDAWADFVLVEDAYNAANANAYNAWRVDAKLKENT
jgi:hypothetical protein